MQYRPATGLHRRSQPRGDALPPRTPWPASSPNADALLDDDYNLVSILAGVYL